MSNPRKPRSFFWRAPFGRLGAALGFRWIMPIGTLPLPFHPWIAKALPSAIIVLIGWGVVTPLVGRPNLHWGHLLAAAGLLGIPMSIPIVNWMAAAFRVPLLQGLLVGGAMLLLAVQVIVGGVPVAWGVLPSAYIALFLVQWIGGPIYLRRIEAANAAFRPIAPGDRTVVMDGDTVAGSYGAWLFRHADIARLTVVPAPSRRTTSLEPRTYHRLAQSVAALVIARAEGLRPEIFSIGGNGVSMPVATSDAAPATVRVSFARHRSPLWLITGHRMMIEIDDGSRVQKLVGGEAALVDAWPIFTCFFWAAIFGGRTQWVTGFARQRPVSLGTTRIYDMLERAFPPLGDDPRLCDPEPLLARIGAMHRQRAQDQAVRAQEDRARAAALLATLLDPTASLPARVTALMHHTDLAVGHGAGLCARLIVARDAKDGAAVRLSAELLASLPADEWRALSPTLIALLNSKVLGFRLLGGDDPSVVDLPERERRRHVIGGFNLVRRVPLLYERLGELGEHARPLVMGLGEMARWPPPLIAARARLDGEG